MICYSSSSHTHVHVSHNIAHTMQVFLSLYHQAALRLKAVRAMQRLSSTLPWCGMACPPLPSLQREPAKQTGARQTLLVWLSALQQQALVFQKDKLQQDILELGTNFFKIYFIDHTSLSDL